MVDMSLKCATQLTNKCIHFYGIFIYFLRNFNWQARNVQDATHISGYSGFNVCGCSSFVQSALELSLCSASAAFESGGAVLCAPRCAVQVCR